jgi:hypothetical protein
MVGTKGLNGTASVAVDSGIADTLGGGVIGWRRRNVASLSAHGRNPMPSSSESIAWFCSPVKLAAAAIARRAVSAGEDDDPKGSTSRLLLPARR